MQKVFCSAKILLFVGDAGQFNQEPRISRRFSNACLERQLGLIPFLQTSQGQPGQKIKVRRLVRRPPRQHGGFLPMASIEGTLRRGKASCIGGGILGESGPTKRKEYD